MESSIDILLRSMFAEGKGEVGEAPPRGAVLTAGVGVALSIEKRVS